MSKPILAVSAFVLFLGGSVGGWVANTNWGSAEGWGKLTTFEKTVYIQGFDAGYIEAKMARDFFDMKVGTRSRIARMKKRDAILSGKVKPQGHHTFGEFVSGVETFYSSDFRNQPVCWAEAVVFVKMSESGEPPTDEELNIARSTNAQSGCPGDVKSDP